MNREKILPTVRTAKHAIHSDYFAVATTALDTVRF